MKDGADERAGELCGLLSGVPICRLGGQERARSPRGGDGRDARARLIRGQSPVPERPLSLVLVGAGKMGSALLGGWFGRENNAGTTTIIIIDPAPSAAAEAAARRIGVRLNPPLAEIAAPAVIFLAIKPQSLDQAAPQIAPLVAPETLIVSILAGKTTANLKARLPAAQAIVRAMPNTP